MTRLKSIVSPSRWSNTALETRLTPFATGEMMEISAPGDDRVAVKRMPPERLRSWGMAKAGVER